MQGQARYVFRLSEDLRSGTLYRAVVPGGEGTILSQDNSAVLAKGQDWTFSTRLDFDQQRPEGPVAGSIRLHHYQVVRDGDLTRNKPTLTRAGLTGIRTLSSTRTGSPRAFRWTSG